MQKIVNYLNFKREIVDNIHLLTSKQEEYMLLYVKEGLDTPQIAQKCGREKSTVSRTLQKGWSRIRLTLPTNREVSATFTFNANGDIIGMRAKAIKGQRGRLRI